MTKPLLEVFYQCVDLRVPESYRFIRLSHAVNSITWCMSASRPSSVMEYPSGTTVDTINLPFSRNMSRSLS